MLDRFNFYDVYAYLFPGLMWLGLTWLPYSFFMSCWPSEAIFSALVGIVGGYVLGHLLYQVTAIASSRKRDGRLDSHILLDDHYPQAYRGFSAPMKTRIRARIAEFFDLHLEGASDADPVRQDAFLMARALLARRKEVYYIEQFQGNVHACSGARWGVSSCRL